MSFFSFLSGIPKEAAVMITGMIPVFELRGAIPLAMSVYKMTVWQAFFWGALGNILPIPFLAIFLERISNYLSKKSQLFNRFFTWLFERTRKKHSHKFEVFEEIALVTFVAIPLPMTGGWGGVVAAFIFGIPPKKAIPLIILGVLLAGIIVSVFMTGLRIIF